MPGAVAAWVATYVFGSSALAGAALATASAVASAAAAAAYVGTAIAITTALSKVSEALMGRPRGPGGSSTRGIVVKTTTGPRGIIYGEVTCGGVVVFMGTTGATNEWLDFVIVVSGHQVEAITDVWFDDDLIPASSINAGAAAGGGVTAGAFAPHDGRTVAYIYKFLGTSSQAASSVLADIDTPNGQPEWTADHKLLGCAYVHIRLRRDAKRYENGPPQGFRFRVKGAKVYDPRKDDTNGGLGDHRHYDATTWEYSNNPALCIADFIAGGTIVNDISTPMRRRGFGASVSDIEWPYVIAAANVCDEDVEVPGSPVATHNRYELDGMVFPSDDTSDADCLEQLLTSMLGQVPFTGGSYRMYAGVYETPAHTLNEDDLAGTVQYATAHGRSERYNTVRGTRHDDMQGSEVEFLSRTAQAYVDADGRSLYRDIELPCTVNEWRAQRIAQTILRRSREQKTIIWQGHLSCARIAVWETVEVTCAELGLAGKVFRCIQRDLRTGGSEALVELMLREENAGTYADPYISDYDTITVSDDPGPVAGALDAPTAFTTEPVSGGILFTITPDIGTPTDAVYEIVEHTASTPVTSADLIWTGAMTKVALPMPSESPLHRGYFWVRARRNAAISDYFPAVTGVLGIAGEGVQGPPGQDGQDGDDGTPAVYVMLTVPHRTLVAYADGTVVSYATAEGYLRVYENGNDITPNASVVLTETGEAGCTGTVNNGDNTPVAGKVKGYYRVTNMSSSEASLAMRVAYNGVNYDLLFTLTKALAGYEIVAVLPTTNLFDGRIVFLTTDGKLYRYVGSPTSSPLGHWTTVVPATDISGQLQTAQIAADAIVASHFNPAISPVEIVGALPGTGNYLGRVAYLTTDWKLYRYTSTGWSRATDGADITANSITAGQIAAGAITADALLIRSGGGALNLDPDMNDPSAWTVSRTPTWATVTDGKVGNRTLRSPGAVLTAQSAQLIPFDPAKTYRIRGWARTYSGGGGVMYMGVSLQDANGANIAGDGSYWGYTAASAVTLSNTWTAYSGTFGSGTAKTFPSNARTMAALVILSYNGSTNHEVQDLRIEEVVPSTLISDGAITTDKIAANAIISEKIAADQINATHIAANAIDANAIQTGVITASKIATNTLTAASGVFADACIGTAEIVNLSVDTIKIAHGAVTDSSFFIKLFDPSNYTGPNLGYGTWGNLVYDATTVQLLVSNIDVDGRVCIFFNATHASNYFYSENNSWSLNYNTIEVRCVRASDNTVLDGGAIWDAGGWAVYESGALSFVDDAPYSTADTYRIQVRHLILQPSGQPDGNRVCQRWGTTSLFALVTKR